MKRINITSTLQKNMTFHSDLCRRHNINKMVINGNIVCPRCELDKEQQQLQKSIQLKYNEIENKRKRNILYKHSIIEDITLLDATIDNYRAEHQEEIQNKQIIVECVERIKNGQAFNVVLQGNQGAGKSHLAYAAVKELNKSGETSSLFISVDGMLRKIRNSFNDPDSKYTESYFTELLSNVDYLVLDDVGAETGAINTDEKASDFVHRVLYAVTTTRQGKVTFITTNLDGKRLFKLYDKKLVSRMFWNPKYIVFKKTKDKRMSNIPF